MTIAAKHDAQPLPPGIRTLFFVRLIGSAGSFVFPFLAMLLTMKYGWTSAAAGAFMTGIAVAGAFGIAVGGKAGDTFGRKRVLVACQATGAAVFACCAALGPSPAVPWLIALASLAMSATWPVLNAMVADLTLPAQRKRAYSLLYWGNNIGFSVGPLAAGFLFARQSGLLFAGNATALAATALLVALAIGETRPAPGPARGPAAERPGRGGGGHEAPETGNVLRLLLRRPLLLAFAGSMAILNFVYAQHSFSLPIFLEKELGAAGPSTFGAAMTANGLAVVAFTPLLTALFVRLPPLACVSAASLLYALGFGSLAFVDPSAPGGRALVLASTVVWTLGEILSATNVNVFIASRSPLTHRSRFNSAVFILANSGSMVCPLATGVFVASWGAAAVWPLAAGLALLGSLLMLLLHAADKASGTGRGAPAAAGLH